MTENKTILATVRIEELQFLPEKVFTLKLELVAKIRMNGTFDFKDHFPHWKHMSKLFSVKS